MGIAITEDHISLADTVRTFVAKRQVRSASRALLDAEQEGRPEFWSELVDLGWLGLHIPEEYGGSGFGLPELVVVAEELGRAVAPGPFLPTVIASAVVAASGSAEQRGRLIPQLVDGTTCAGVGLGGQLTVTDSAITGDAGIVLGAGTADLLVLAAGGDVVVIPTNAPGVTIDVPRNVDPTRRSGRVTLDNVEVASADILRDAQPTALALTRTLVSAEAVGGAQDCLDEALAYAKVREQFGRTIGTFQAVKHHLANMLVAVEAALATVWDTARVDVDVDDEAFQLMAACAATLSLPAYQHNAELNIQVHGGIGYTWEHDAHLHLRRALVLNAEFGGGGAGDVFELSAKGAARQNMIELPPEAEQLRDGVRAELAGWSDLGADELRTRMIDSGLLMPHWPKPWGRAAGAVEQLVIEEELNASGIKRPDLGITGWVILTLIQHGTPEQIERYVAPALSEEEEWCQLFSEPGAGSDAAAVSTKAVRAEGGWLVTGQKVWTSNAMQCKLGLATVRTDPAASKHAGVTTVIIDMKAPGVEVRPLRQITGESHFNEVFFTDVFVPDSDVVGEPNKGWTVARATLGNERVSIGGRRAGGEDAVKYLVSLTRRNTAQLADAAERTGRYIAEDHALRLLNLRRVTRSVAGSEPGPEGNVTKLMEAEHTVLRAKLSAELFGPEVVLAAGPARMAGYMVLASRGMTIAGGTSEITRNQIAERILGLPRDPLIR